MVVKMRKAMMVILSYTAFSTLVGGALLYFGGDMPLMWGISIGALLLALISAYVASSMREGVKKALAEFYKDRGATINDTVADVSRPYRRAILYDPPFIDRIVDGKDPYVVYPIASLRMMSSWTDEDLILQADLGKRVFWNVFLEMLESGLISLEIKENGKVFLFVRRCRDITPVMNEVCEFIRRASAREEREIPYDMEVFSSALTLDTLKQFMNEKENIATPQSLTRFDHLGIILFTMVVGEFSLKETRDTFPPVKLDGDVMGKLEVYRSVYAAASMFATVIWVLPLFGISLFAALAAVVGFAFGYLYMPHDIYHPSIPWYNRYKVWHHIRKRLFFQSAPMSVEDVLHFVILDGQDKRDFMLSIVLGTLQITL